MNEIKIGSIWRHKELGNETIVIDVDEKYVKTTTDSSGSGLKRSKDVFLHFYEIVDEEKETMIDVNNVATGLTSEQVLDSRVKYGSNKLPEKKLKTAWDFFKETFEDRLNQILMAMMIVFTVLAVSGQGSFSEPLGIFVVTSVIVREYACQPLCNSVHCRIKYRVSPELGPASCGAILVYNHIVHVQTVLGNRTCHQSAFAIIDVATCCRNVDVLAYEHLAHFCPVLPFCEHGVQCATHYVDAQKA